MDAEEWSISDGSSSSGLQALLTDVHPVVDADHAPPTMMTPVGIVAQTSPVSSRAKLHTPPTTSCPVLAQGHLPLPSQVSPLLSKYFPGLLLKLKLHAVLFSGLPFCFSI